MSTFNHTTGYHLITPPDHEAAERAARLRTLGLSDTPHDEFDAFATNLARGAADLTRTAVPLYAMVNLVSEGRQYFVGLHNPATDPSRAPSGHHPAVGREMPRDYGFCPHVVARRKPLVLQDVCDYPRYAGNPVVSSLGVRTYLGAPLTNDDDGPILGTVCVVGTEPHPWGQEALDFIKAQSAEAMRLLSQLAIS
ncbi:GAF domain-containing protein [Streptomyces sp. NPDC058280]|uniref:GAF domain-containing protein n=1 Tax=Streptomyces sp. NPDC058280 TaxID=3346419 RepID=UPI0036E277A1